MERDTSREGLGNDPLTFGHGFGGKSAVIVLVDGVRCDQRKKKEKMSEKLS